MYLIALLIRFRSTICIPLASVLACAPPIPNRNFRLLGLRAKLVNGLADLLGEDFHLAGLQLQEVEYTIEGFSQSPPALFDQVGIVGQRATGRQLKLAGLGADRPGEADDPGLGRADLAVHVRGDGRFHPADLLDVLFRLVEDCFPSQC